MSTAEIAAQTECFFYTMHHYKQMIADKSGLKQMFRAMLQLQWG